MSGDDRPSSELDPEERSVDERLRRDRPTPPAAYRGALGRRVAAEDPGFGPRPAQLWAMVGGYMLVAALLILLGLLQASGAL